MSAKDAFTFTSREWAELEEKYSVVAHLPADRSWINIFYLDSS
jgi:hypothetical protein